MTAYKFLRYILPIVLAVICQQAIRLVTDISIDSTFWISPIKHVKELLISIPFFYFADWRIRVSLKKERFANKHTIDEYSIWAVYFSFWIILGVFCIHQILVIPDYFRDYVIAVVTCTPILLFYYTLVRNGLNKKKIDFQNLELEKIKVDQAEIELKFLKSQYHPHFLFNALNTIYFQVDDENREAKQSIEQLSNLLRYQLYDIEQEVTLEQEISYLKSFIAFQQLRMSERLVLDMYFDPELKEQKIHPLLFQPLIENAFKYVRGDYRIKLELRLKGSQILFLIENTLFTNSDINRGKNSGIGIENLKRRLDLLYRDKYSFETEQTDYLFVAKLTIDIG